MKHNRIQMNIGIFSMMLICLASLTGCGGTGSSWDDDDLYEYTWEEYLSEYTMNASDLAGTWTIEKVKDYVSGEVAEINQTFTILPFNLDEAEETNIADVNYSGLTFHYATYKNKVRYNGTDGEDLNDLSLYLIGKKGESKKKSRVYMYSFSIDTSDGGSLAVSLNHIDFSKGKATAIGAVVISSYVNDKFTYNSYSGEVTLTKK